MLPSFIIFHHFQDLLFSGIALEIPPVVFAYELINYEIIILYTWLCNYSALLIQWMQTNTKKSVRPEAFDGIHILYKSSNCPGDF